MTQLFANNAYGSLGATLSNIATSLTLATGQGARFPSPTGGDYFLLTLVGLDGNGNENAWEIVKVTGRSTDALTIVRAQESTTAATWVSGTRVELRSTAGTFDSFTDTTQAAAAAPVQSVAGRTGTVVLTKTDVGLASVENKSSATIRGELTSSNVTTALGFTPENAANKGVAGGYASLDGSGFVPASQLPSFVDDVLEYANAAAFPAIGVTGKIYVALDTGRTWRWSGSVYTEIIASPGTTDAISEGAGNLFFTNARARSAISVTQNLTYNASTGVITGPDLSPYLLSATAASTYATLANPTFSGAIKGDFSNANTSLRLAFQSSTLNGNTIVPAKPNGTGTASYYIAHNNSDTENSGHIYLGITSSAALIRADKTGTGAYLPLAVAVGGTERFRVNETTGNFLIGGASDDGINKLQVTGSISATGLIKHRIFAIADGTSITLNADTTDIATQANTQATGTLTMNAPTGTPVNGQKLLLRLTSTNVQTFSWNAIFLGSTDAALPTASSGGGKEDYMGFIYDSTAAKWHLLAKNFGF